MKLREVGRTSEAEAYDIITKSFSKNPTKHAEGGRIGFNPGGPVDQEALIQMYIAEGLSYEEAVASGSIRCEVYLWDTLKKAEGGRAEFIFGGSAGLKGMWKQMMKGISERRGGEPVKRLFPGLSARDKAMEKVVIGTPEQKAFRAREKDLKIEGIDLLINRLKNDKKILERQAKNKKMGDPGLDFLMKKLEENMSEAYTPHLKKYTDIDKDILDMETIKKNMIMKDRKLNAEGGRVSYSGGGRAGLPAITYGMSQPEMQGPQMPVSAPQPTGIPGANLQMNQMDLMQQKMQQNPWMQNQGMQQPYKGQLRMPFGLGGMSRRAFMKLMGGITGTGIAAGSGLLKFGKAAKVVPKVTETIVQSNAAGMPPWFPSLVKRVLKEGKDETEKLATIERQTVHTAKTPEGTPIQVTRDLVTDDIVVDIGEQTKHGWSSGRHGQPARLELKKGEWIEPSTEGGGYMTKGGDNVYPGMSKGAMETGETSGKGIKTKDEFWVEEAEFTGGHPENVKFEETVDFKYGDHGSDFSEIEQYATKKHSFSNESVGEVSRAQRREGMWGKKEQARQLALDKKHGGLKSTYKKDPHVRGKQADEYDKMRDEGYFDEAEKDFYEGKASGGLARTH